MELQTFNFDNKAVRTVVDEHGEWFCARDVATTLGYVNPGKAIRMHCKQEGGSKTVPPSNPRWCAAVHVHHRVGCDALNHLF